MLNCIAFNLFQIVQSKYNQSVNRPMRQELENESNAKLAQKQ